MRRDDRAASAQAGRESERCNGKDDDCDGTNDDSPVDEGSSCGSSVGDCTAGVTRCQSGAPVCTGQVGPQPEACDGRDNNCDGAIDGTLPSAPLVCTTDAECANQGAANVCLARSTLNPNDKVCTVPAPLPAGTPVDCDVPPPPPAGVPQPCRKGTMTCLAGSLVCRGSIRPAQLLDNCGEDSNCDGILSVTVDLQTDVANCGTCGNDCRAVNAASHGVWACQAGQCVRTALRLRVHQLRHRPERLRTGVHHHVRDRALQRRRRQLRLQRGQRHRDAERHAGVRGVEQRQRSGLRHGRRNRLHQRSLALHLQHAGLLHGRQPAVLRHDAGHLRRPGQQL